MLKTILLFSLLIYAGTLFSQSKEAIVNFEEGFTSAKIDVSIFDNVIYIPVSINNNPPLDFVLDTGAPEISIVESEIASKLELSTKKGGAVRGAGNNNVNFKFLEDVTLSLPNIEFINPRLGSSSLIHMEPYWGKPKYGLLGGNILKELITEIDYIERSVTFYQPDNFEYRGTGKRLPIKIVDNAIYVNASLLMNDTDKVIEGSFIIDTAVRNTFLNSPFTRKHKLIEKSKRIVENITGFGLGGVGFGKLSRLQYIEIGGYRVNGPIVELTTDTKGVAASERFDGIIGADILSRFKVIFDYSRGEMILEPNENFQNAFEYDRSGIYLILDRENVDLYKVAHVIVDSPASKAGMAKDDVLLEVDDNHVKNFNYEEIKNYFKGEGKKVRLKILRDKRVLDFEIKLENLL